MSTIKLFVTHTPNRVNKKIENNAFEHIIAGAVYNTIPTTMQGDNTGNNISSKNKSYCELTTQYWAWKNTNYDYYGFCHYRRFFSFCQSSLPESAWGVIEYPNITESAIKELCLNESEIQKMVEEYDFLIAKGIPVTHLRAGSVREHYALAPELNAEDFDCMMDIINEKHPFLSPFAKAYAKGKIYYPCNMFIMKKDMFQEYSELLFTILEEFENRTDISNYSMQGHRVTGHLAERILGIYYLYIQSQKKYKTRELQIALFKDTSVEKEILPSSKGAVPVVLAANNNYAPILATCLKSIINHTVSSRNYDIVVFHTDITMDNQQKMLAMADNYSNVRTDFLNISSHVADYKLEARAHITTETFYRFLILDIMKSYEKVIYLDSDLIVREDLAKLYDTDMGTHLIAATKDADFQGQMNKPGFDTKDYCIHTMKMSHPYEYFQAGVLIFNVQEMGKVTSVKELLKIADQDLYRYSDQDILNVLCEGRVTFLNLSWNMIFDCNRERIKEVIHWAPVKLYDEYMEARKDPKIIHYAGFLKPWTSPDEDFAEEFWKVARDTDYYEILLYNMVSKKDDRIKSKQEGLLHKVVRKTSYFFFPINSRRREKIIRLMKIRG